MRKGRMARAIQPFLISTAAATAAPSSQPLQQRLLFLANRCNIGYSFKSTAATSAAQFGMGFQSPVAFG
ncbi:MAG: hypothetical protein H7X86_11530 [Gorillibacterium sp.]|nr:hypothetical protein [Gorillibacterium sp.]